MRKILLLGLALVIGVGLLPAGVFAQEEQAAPEASQTVETQSATPVAEARNDEGRATRLQNYKDRLAETLTFSQERKLQQTCVAAQEKVLSLSENIETVRENRESRYSTAIDKLNKLAAKLELAGVDGSELRDSVASLQAEVDIFKATLTDYQTILSDLSSMDCASDAEGFKAALAAARQQRTTLVSSSTGIRTYYTEKIKPLLEQLRQDLET